MSSIILQKLLFFTQRLGVQSVWPETILTAQRLFSSQRSTMGVIDVTNENGVQVIRLNRPEKKNAINIEMYDKFIDALKKSANDDDVVLTVVTGNGDYYSSGNDFSPANFTDMEEAVEMATATTRKFVASFIDYPKLLIAVVNGPAIGIAATTLALCDVVYASDKAWFRTPFSQLGLVPEGCSTLIFPRLMGAAKASRLLYLNETLSASDAQSCGFVTELFPDSQLRAQTTKKIEQFAKLPLQSLQESKKLVREWDRELLHRVNEIESKKLGERFRSEDFFKAMLAFNQRKSKL